MDSSRQEKCHEVNHSVADDRILSDENLMKHNLGISIMMKIVSRMSAYVYGCCDLFLFFLPFHEVPAFSTAVLSYVIIYKGCVLDKVFFDHISKFINKWFIKKRFLSIMLV